MGAYEVGTCNCPIIDMIYINNQCECPAGLSLNTFNRCSCPNDYMSVNPNTNTCECPKNSYFEVQASNAEVCVCGVARGDGLDEILRMDYDYLRGEYYCTCRNSQLTYNEDLKKCECGNGFEAQQGECGCEAPRVIKFDQAANLDICVCPLDHQVYDETNHECKCDDRNGYVMNTTGECSLAPIENCKVQTGKNFKDCTQCVVGILYDSSALPNANPCACGDNMEYRDHDEFGNSIEAACYCVSGRTGANCDEIPCNDSSKTCDVCFESYPDQCLKCKDHVLVASESTFDFNQMNLHDHPIVTCAQECEEGYNWNYSNHVCEKIE